MSPELLGLLGHMGAAAAYLFVLGRRMGIRSFTRWTYSGSGIRVVSRWRWLARWKWRRAASKLVPRARVVRR